MAICPHCEQEGDRPFEPCPSGDGFFLVDEDQYRDHRDDPWLGRELGERFVIAALLGRGSMARVYRAYQRQVERTVALKLFEREDVAANSDPDAGPDDRDRFIREARVLAKLSHPNCVTLYDFGYAGGDDFLYIAMEHVAGISLRGAIRRGLKFDSVAEVLRQVLMALREAHALDIVHRDLKPENVVLSHRQTSDEQIVKVLDFGIAKLLGKQPDTQKTRAGQLFGTPAYMSPEQCRGETDVTPASDIYALGCITFELVTGHLPFQAEVPRDLVRQHQYEPVPPLQPRRGIEPPEEFETFVRTCLAKEPDDRYADAAEALAAFEEVLGGDQQSGQLARGLDDLGADTGRVDVPESRVSGARLDPTGGGKRPDFDELELQQDQPDSPQSEGAGTRDDPEADARVTDTVRSVDDESSAGEGDGTSNRIGLVVAAALVVLLFCVLLFAFVVLTLKG